MEKSRRGLWWVIGALVAAIVIIIVAFLVLRFLQHKQEQESNDKITTPNYVTVLPSGKTIASLGGWVKISPQGAQPVFAYADSIDEVKIRVSEQPLPAGQSLADIAKSYNATETIDSSKGKIYLGSNHSGPQSVLANIKHTLILINSDTKISDTSWKAYIEGLD